jgi:CO/xanthine dehydrogenase FAD-binding subunit
VKPAPFAYRRVDTVDEALSILADEGDEAKVLAGGQSLAPMLNLRLANPEMLVDVGRVPLRDIEVVGTQLRIGALVTHRTLEHDSTIAREAPLLAKAAALIGHPAIRNRGTIGGSLVHADPAAELGLTALAVGAAVVAQSTRGTRRIPMDAFLDGPFMSTLEPDEMVVAIEVPRHGDCTVAFEEVAVRSGDFAVAAVAVLVRLTAEGVMHDPSIAVGGVAGAPFRATEAEALLAGTRYHPREAREAGRLAARAARPTTDTHGTADYRRGLVTPLVERALARAMKDGAN